MEPAWTLACGYCRLVEKSLSSLIQYHPGRLVDTDPRSQHRIQVWTSRNRGVQESDCGHREFLSGDPLDVANGLSCTGCRMSNVRRKLHTAVDDYTQVRHFLVCWHLLIFCMNLLWFQSIKEKMTDAGFACKLFRQDMYSTFFVCRLPVVAYMKFSR